MSSTIWTRCEGDSEIGPLRLKPWRAIESQHQVSTRRLVGSAAEQELLEALLEQSKPEPPAGRRLHYLLFTPFRYPPLRHGSRFGRYTERGIWYGSEALQTAFAEVAYYRLLFLEGTTADLGTVTAPLTAFTASVRTDFGVDLTAPPFAPHERVLASPTSHAQTQPFGRSMREAGVEVFRYRSARDVSGGVNVGVFSPGAFSRSRPSGFQEWHCTASRLRVEFSTRSYVARTVHTYPREDFLVDGTLPAPGP